MNEEQVATALVVERFVEFVGAHGRPVAVNPARVDYAEGRSLRDNQGKVVSTGTELYMGNRTMVVQGGLAETLDRLVYGPDRLVEVKR